MNKNAFIKLLSALIIISVLLCTAGCSVGKGKEIKTGNNDVGVVDFDKLDSDSGTVVYTHKNNSDKDAEPYTENINVENVDKAISFGAAPFDDDKSKDDFKNQTGMSDYGIDKKEAEKIADNPAEWKTFYIVKYVENKTDKVMVFKSVKPNNNGENGIYIRSLLDGEIGIAPGNSTAITVYGVADMSKFDTDEALDAALDDVGVQLVYALTDNEFGDIDDWNEVTTNVVRVK